MACLLLQGTGSALAQPTNTAVTAIRVEGNTLLPEQLLSRLTRPIDGTSLSLSELKALAARIQMAYRDAGYGGVVAYLPSQETSDGQIVIRVVEGKLAAVRVTGNIHFDSDNIRAGLPHLQQGTTPRLRYIDRDIQLSNSNPAKHLNVSLTAGSRPGDIDADVSVTDARPLQYLIGYNNTGDAMTGRHRISVGIEHANLFGRDHVGTVQYQTSPENPERVKIFSAGYRLPMYVHAASFDAFVARSSVSNGTTATTAGPLSFTGKGTIVGLRGNLYLDRIGEYDHYITFGLDRRAYDDDCSVGEFGSAACGSAAVDVTTMPVSVSYTGQKGSATLAYGVSAALVTNAAGSSQRTFEAARPGAARHYVLSHVAAFLERTVVGGATVNARVELQASAHALIPAEKFGIGGANSVRGYAERELSGDSGILVRIEAAAPSLDLAQGAGLRPYLFIDHGRVTNHGDTPCNGAAGGACKLTGAGAGVRLAVRKSASASVDIGRAMEHGARSLRGAVRAHLALKLAF